VRYIFAVLLLISTAAFFGCSSDNSVSGQQGSLRVLLTDAPVDLKQVWVTISAVEVHQTSGSWTSVSQSSKSIDLLTLQNAQDVLTTANLPDGNFTGIRLQISDGHVIEQDNSRCELKVPSDKIEIPVQFDIKQGKTTTVLLDFKGEQSVHVVKTGNNRRCILRPVLLPVSVQQD
jgi:hypothetical protein